MGYGGVYSTFVRDLRDEKKAAAAYFHARILRGVEVCVVVNDCKFLVKIVFFSHTKPVSSK